MQHVGGHYNTGIATDFHHMHYPPTNNTATNATTGPSTTSVLRSWRKKDASEKQSNAAANAEQTNANASTESQGPVARVAPHNHYPKPTPTVAPGDIYNRYQQQYGDFGVQNASQLPAPVKYSEIIEPMQSIEQIPPIHLQKPKEKTYLDMCSVQQNHVKTYHQEYPNYKQHYDGIKNYNNHMSGFKQQYHHHPHAYLQKESQMCGGYPVQKESNVPHPPPPPPQYLQNYKLSPPSANYPRNYPREGGNEFLANLNKIAPDMAQDIINDPHLREPQFPMYPPAMDQNRLYQQQHHQRMYQRSSPIQYPPIQNYPQKNIPQNYNQYPMNQQRIPPADPYRMYPPHQRYGQVDQIPNNISPRQYHENIMGFPPRLPPSYPPCNQLEYPQHYQPRQVPIRQDYLPLPPPNKPYIEAHPDIPEIVPEDSLHQPKKTLKAFLENWREEFTEEVEGGASDQGNPDKTQPGKSSGSAREDTLYVLDAMEIPSENIPQYLHLQPIEKLPPNIRAFTYNNSNDENPRQNAIVISTNAKPDDPSKTTDESGLKEGGNGYQLFQQPFKSGQIPSDEDRPACKLLQSMANARNAHVDKPPEKLMQQQQQQVCRSLPELITEDGEEIGRNHDHLESEYSKIVDSILEENTNNVKNSRKMEEETEAGKRGVVDESHAPNANFSENDLIRNLEMVERKSVIAENTLPHHQHQAVNSKESANIPKTPTTTTNEEFRDEERTITKVTNEGERSDNLTNLADLPNLEDPIDLSHHFDDLRPARKNEDSTKMREETDETREETNPSKNPDQTIVGISEDRDDIGEKIASNLDEDVPEEIEDGSMEEDIESILRNEDNFEDAIENIAELEERGEEPTPNCENPANIEDDVLRNIEEISHNRNEESDERDEETIVELSIIDVKGENEEEIEYIEEMMALQDEDLSRNFDEREENEDEEVRPNRDEEKDEEICLNRHEEIRLNSDEGEDQEIRSSHNEDEDEEIHPNHNEEKDEEIHLNRNEEKDAEIGLNRDEEEDEEIRLNHDEEEDQRIRLDHNEEKDEEIRLNGDEEKDDEIRSNHDEESEDDFVYEEETPEGEALTDPISSIIEETEERDHNDLLNDLESPNISEEILSPAMNEANSENGEETKEEMTGSDDQNEEIEASDDEEVPMETNNNDIVQTLTGNDDMDPEDDRSRSSTSSPEKEVDSSFVLEIAKELLQINVSRDSDGGKVISITPLTKVKVVTSTKMKEECDNDGKMSEEIGVENDECDEEIEKIHEDSEEIIEEEATKEEIDEECEKITEEIEDESEEILEESEEITTDLEEIDEAEIIAAITNEEEVNHADAIEEIVEVIVTDTTEVPEDDPVIRNETGFETDVPILDEEVLFGEEIIEDDRILTETDLDLHNEVIIETKDDTNDIVIPLEQAQNEVIVAETKEESFDKDSWIEEEIIINNNYIEHLSCVELLKRKDETVEEHRVKKLKKYPNKSALKKHLKRTKTKQMKIVKKKKKKKKRKRIKCDLSGLKKVGPFEKNKIFSSVVVIDKLPMESLKKFASQSSRKILKKAEIDNMKIKELKKKHRRKIEMAREKKLKKKKKRALNLLEKEEIEPIRKSLEALDVHATKTIEELKKSPTNIEERKISIPQSPRVIEDSTSSKTNENAKIRVNVGGGKSPRIIEESQTVGHPKSPPILQPSNVIESSPKTSKSIDDPKPRMPQLLKIVGHPKYPKAIDDSKPPILQPLRVAERSTVSRGSDDPNRQSLQLLEVAKHLKCSKTIDDSKPPALLLAKHVESSEIPKAATAQIPKLMEHPKASSSEDLPTLQLARHVKLSKIPKIFDDSATVRIPNPKSGNFEDPPTLQLAKHVESSKTPKVFDDRDKPPMLRIPKVTGYPKLGNFEDPPTLQLAKHVESSKIPKVFDDYDRPPMVRIPKVTGHPKLGNFEDPPTVELAKHVDSSKPPKGYDDYDKPPMVRIPKVMAHPKSGSFEDPPTLQLAKHVESSKTPKVFDDRDKPPMVRIPKVTGHPKLGNFEDPPTLELAKHVESSKPPKGFNDYDKPPMVQIPKVIGHPKSGTFDDPRLPNFFDNYKPPPKTFEDSKPPVLRHLRAIAEHPKTHDDHNPPVLQSLRAIAKHPKILHDSKPPVLQPLRAMVHPHSPTTLGDSKPPLLLPLKHMECSQSPKDVDDLKPPVLVPFKTVEDSASPKRISANSPILQSSKAVEAPSKTIANPNREFQMPKSILKNPTRFLHPKDLRRSKSDNAFHSDFLENFKKRRLSLEEYNSRKKKMHPKVPNPTMEEHPKVPNPTIEDDVAPPSVPVKDKEKTMVEEVLKSLENEEIEFKSEEEHIETDTKKSDDDTSKSGEEIPIVQITEDVVEKPLRTIEEVKESQSPREESKAIPEVTISKHEETNWDNYEKTKEQHIIDKSTIEEKLNSLEEFLPKIAPKEARSPRKFEDSQIAKKLEEFLAENPISYSQKFSEMALIKRFLNREILTAEELKKVSQIVQYKRAIQTIKKSGTIEVSPKRRYSSEYPKSIKIDFSDFDLKKNENPGPQTASKEEKKVRVCYNRSISAFIEEESKKKSSDKAKNRPGPITEDGREAKTFKLNKEGADATGHPKSDLLSLRNYRKNSNKIEYMDEDAENVVTMTFSGKVQSKFTHPAKNIPKSPQQIDPNKIPIPELLPFPRTSTSSKSDDDDKKSHLSSDDCKLDKESFAVKNKHSILNIMSGKTDSSSQSNLIKHAIQNIIKIENTASKVENWAKSSPKPSNPEEDDLEATSPSRNQNPIGDEMLERTKQPLVVGGVQSNQTTPISRNQSPIRDKTLQRTDQPVTVGGVQSNQTTPLSRNESQIRDKFSPRTDQPVTVGGVQSNQTTPLSRNQSPIRDKFSPRTDEPVTAGRVQSNQTTPFSRNQSPIRDKFLSRTDQSSIVDGIQLNRSTPRSRDQTPVSDKIVREAEQAPIVGGVQSDQTEPISRNKSPMGISQNTEQPIIVEVVQSNQTTPLSRNQSPIRDKILQRTDQPSLVDGTQLNRGKPRSRDQTPISDKISQNTDQLSIRGGIKSNQSASSSRDHNPISDKIVREADVGGVQLIQTDPISRNKSPMGISQNTEQPTIVEGVQSNQTTPLYHSEGLIGDKVVKGVELNPTPLLCDKTPISDKILKAIVGGAQSKQTTPSAAGPNPIRNQITQIVEAARSYQSTNTINKDQSPLTKGVESDKTTPSSRNRNPINDKGLKMDQSSIVGKVQSNLVTPSASNQAVIEDKIVKTDQSACVEEVRWSHAPIREEVVISGTPNETRGNVSSQPEEPSRKSFTGEKTSPDENPENGKTDNNRDGKREETIEVEPVSKVKIPDIKTASSSSSSTPIGSGESTNIPPKGDPKLLKFKNKMDDPKLVRKKMAENPKVNASRVATADDPRSVKTTSPARQSTTSEDETKSVKIKDLKTSKIKTGHPNPISSRSKSSDHREKVKSHPFHMTNFKPVSKTKAQLKSFQDSLDCGPKSNDAKDQNVSPVISNITKLTALLTYYQKGLESGADDANLKKVGEIIDRISPNLKNLPNLPEVVGGSSNEYEVSAKPENEAHKLKLHLKKKSQNENRKRKKRFRNLYGGNDSDEEAPKNKEARLDEDGNSTDYSVYQRKSPAGVPKLVIKRRKSDFRNNLQPYVRIRRAESIENMVKRRKRSIMLDQVDLDD